MREGYLVDSRVAVEQHGSLRSAAISRDRYHNGNAEVYRVKIDERGKIVFRELLLAAERTVT